MPNQLDVAQWARSLDHIANCHPSIARDGHFIGASAPLSCHLRQEVKSSLSAAVKKRSGIGLEIRPARP